ncbi:hypothetical protein MYAM1_002038 [Malassezia yamatoensis]|uniref:DUF3835 domain-containing protein n=1 Tax=Malassezia yamatoensis TaxID=253288 RepID=A0AAJ5YZ97_9BASI|nr:hypothetical protein MYAM1_002038 [Malassezia yamatoensis]
MADSQTIAPLLDTARGIVERIQGINSALELLQNEGETQSDFASTLSAEDRQGLASLTPEAKVALLQRRRNDLVQRRNELKQEFASHVGRSMESSLQQLLPESLGNDQQSNGKLDQVLNEEGLPFVDPVEIVHDEDSSLQSTAKPSNSSLSASRESLRRAPGQVEPFHAEQLPRAGQSRKQWMDSVLSSLEQQEKEELSQEETQDSANITSTTPENTQSMPMKPIQRGFLQRQAAAERASGHSKLENNDTSKKPKKQVRIVAPDSESDDDQQAQQMHGTERKGFKSVQYGRHPDDVGVEEEAARIVDMLGPQVIEGHPNAQRIFADIEAEQQRRVQMPEQQPRDQITETEPAKPAIGDSIVEREANTNTISEKQPTAPRKKLSAFKQRQLDRQKQTETDSPQIPHAPKVSHNVSAIERAGQVDDSLQANRAQKGLPPRVPHARPSKAYAERLAKRRETGSERLDRNREIEVEDVPLPPTDGKRAVRFGATTVVEPEEDDENLPFQSQQANTAMDMDDEENMSQDSYEQESDQSSEDDLQDEGLWDSDEEYTAADLEALKPKFEGHEDDAYWNEELAREYAEAKARLSLLPSSSVAGQAMDEDQEDAAESYGIAPLDASLADTAPEKHSSQSSRRSMSKFKAARLAGEPLPNPHDDLAARQNPTNDVNKNSAVSSTTQPAPIMVLPSLAPVRYPRPTPAPNEIDLDGESDEDDDRLQELMRARLDLANGSSDAFNASPSERQSQPPKISSSSYQ